MNEDKFCSLDFTKVTGTSAGKRSSFRFFMRTFFISLKKKISLVYGNRPGETFVVIHPHA